VELWSSIVVGLLLVLVAWWLVRSHLLGWHAVRQRANELDPEEIDFRRRQTRRRIQTSTMLGLVGIAMLVGRLLIVWRAPPTLILLFWGGVVLLVLWLGVLAVADMVATRYYFNRLREKYLVEQARLQAQLRRMERTRGNGQADEEPKRKPSEGQEG
jgi:hypothetical protein